MSRAGVASEVVVVRAARAGDAAARARLVREALLSLTGEAFCYYFFHEATLQGTVLCGAALFIFCGAGWGALLAAPGAALAVLLCTRAALEAAAARAAARLPRERAGWVAERRGPPRPPGAALAVLLCTRAALEAAAARAAARLPRERAGWVAERRGPPRPPSATPPTRVPVVFEDQLTNHAPQYCQIIGTVSVWACTDAAGGWLGALGVAAAWRRRGAARGLEAAARAGAARLGYPALHALTSALTPGARCLLHAAGWELSGGYARPLLGAAVTLPLARLEYDLQSCA